MNQNDTTPTVTELLAQIARLQRENADLHKDIALLHSTATEATTKLRQIQEILK